MGAEKAVDEAGWGEAAARLALRSAPVGHAQRAPWRGPWASTWGLA